MGERQKRINFKSLQNSPEYKKKFNWAMIPSNLEVIQDSLINRNATDDQIVAAFSQIIPESGGSTANHANGSKGLISRRGVRKANYPNTLPGQIHVEMENMFGPRLDPNEWNHGGKGSGYRDASHARSVFQNSPTLWDTTNAIMRGFVRPEPTEYQKRFNFANFLQQFLK